MVHLEASLSQDFKWRLDGDSDFSVRDGDKSCFTTDGLAIVDNLSLGLYKFPVALVAEAGIKVDQLAVELGISSNSVAVRGKCNFHITHLLMVECKVTACLEVVQASTVSTIDVQIGEILAWCFNVEVNFHGWGNHDLKACFNLLGWGIGQHSS